MFYRNEENGYSEVLPGILLKTLAHGEKTLCAEFRMNSGSSLPVHSHPHEQTGYLVKGKIILNIGRDKHNVNPGDCWCIPGNVEHSAEILTDSVAIEVFSPLREDYLKFENSGNTYCI